MQETDEPVELQSLESSGASYLLGSLWALVGWEKLGAQGSAGFLDAEGLRGTVRGERRQQAQAPHHSMQPPAYEEKRVNRCW